MSVETSLETITPATVPSAPSTNSDTRWLRRGGIAGLLASTAYLATGLLATLAGRAEAPDGPADMPRYLAEIADAELAHILYAIAGIALCVLYVPMSLALTELLKGRANARLGTVSVVAGLVILFPAYVLAGASTTGLLAARDSMDGGGMEALFTVQQFSETASLFFFGAGSVLSLGVGPFLWGLAGRAGRELPRWVSRLALGVGVTGLVWAIPPSDDPIIMVLVLANVLGSLVLFTGISWKLMRSE